MNQHTYSEIKQSRDTARRGGLKKRREHKNWRGRGESDDEKIYNQLNYNKNKK